MQTATVSGEPAVNVLAAGGPKTANIHNWKTLLLRTFGVEFALFNGLTGEAIEAAASPLPFEGMAVGEMCREVARRGSPEFLLDEDSVLVLALPFDGLEDRAIVAVAVFVTREIGGEDERLAGMEERWGMAPGEFRAWALAQTPWRAESLLRVCDLVRSHFDLHSKLSGAEHETESLSDHLASTYEEISLLHRLAQNLRLSRSDEDLGRMALEGMQEVVSARGLALQLLPLRHADQATASTARNGEVLLVSGKCPLAADEFSALIAHLDITSLHHPLVINPPITERSDWPFPQVRQLILAPMSEGENLFGWLAALNHLADGEFGTVEASLLGSVAAILGIHSGNIELYRQQSELLAGIVRALTSAIDAKDPYTCGHSDRVARIAVRLAEELGCGAELRNTIYLAGLLHDIGKIGVEDSVLRKPGGLSKEEYEHIKQHVEIGHRILSDLSKLEGVLPAVLHHHESWDGTGYPRNLEFEQIPFPARVVAVADAFDAMSSDRPYRSRMPADEVDAIFRAGAGRQWDPDVIAAFFRARDDIRRIYRDEAAMA